MIPGVLPRPQESSHDPRSPPAHERRGTSKTCQSPLTRSGRPVDRPGEGPVGHAPTRKWFELGPVTSGSPQGRWQSIGEAPGQTWGHVRRQTPGQAAHPAALSPPAAHPPQAEPKPGAGTGGMEPGNHATTPRARWHSWRLGQHSQAPAQPQQTQQGGPTGTQGLSWPRALGGERTLRTQLLGPWKQCRPHPLPARWPTDPRSTGRAGIRLQGAGPVWKAGQAPPNAQR